MLFAENRKTFPTRCCWGSEKILLFTGIWTHLTRHIKRTSPTVSSLNLIPKEDICVTGIPSCLLVTRFDVKVMVTMPKVPEPKFLQEIENADDITFCVLENLMYAALSLNEDEFSQYQVVSYCVPQSTIPSTVVVLIASLGYNSIVKHIFQIFWTFNNWWLDPTSGKMSVSIMYNRSRITA